MAQKIDPAMLASTVTEYLLPKIELGLLYTYGVSEEMCRGWTSTKMRKWGKWREEL